MKTLKIIMGYIILVFVLITYQWAGLPCDKSDGDLNVLKFPEKISELIPFIESVDCFEYAELVTGFSAEVLRGIAAIESDFRTDVVGDDGMSFGMFQLHSRWHKSRVEKWGEFDPIDPFESAVIAGWIMRENLKAFDGDLRLAIAAYKQGIRGVRERNAIQWYVDDVLNWRNNSKKVLSFFLFRGITNIEVLHDRNKDAGTQNTYKFNDSPAVQVSWRGSGGIPY
jgi:hypothetical protein